MAKPKSPKKSPTKAGVMSADTCSACGESLDHECGLRAAITRQASSATMGMNAAHRHASANLREAERLRAESSPDALESERAANAMMSEEIEHLRAEIEAWRWCAEHQAHATWQGTKWWVSMDNINAMFLVEAATITAAVASAKRKLGGEG